jgi:hypothetical protein
LLEEELREEDLEGLGFCAANAAATAEELLEGAIGLAIRTADDGLDDLSVRAN